MCRAVEAAATQLVVLSKEKGIAEGIFRQREEVRSVLGMGAAAAKKMLCDRGRKDLAARVSKQQKARNTLAHPDVGLERELKGFAEEFMMSTAGVDRAECSECEASECEAVAEQAPHAVVGGNAVDLLRLQLAELADRVAYLEKCVQRDALDCWFAEPGAVHVVSGEARVSAKYGADGGMDVMEADAVGILNVVEEQVNAAPLMGADAAAGQVTDFNVMETDAGVVICVEEADAGVSMVMNGLAGDAVEVMDAMEADARAGEVMNVKEADAAGGMDVMETVAVECMNIKAVNVKEADGVLEAVAGDVKADAVNVREVGAEGTTAELVEKLALGVRWADVAGGSPRIADVPTEHSTVCPPRADAGAVHGNGPGAAAGKNRHRQRGHMPFTPVQRKAIKVKLSAGDRNIIGEDFDTGEVLQVAKSYAWVRPCGPLPLEVERVFARAERDFEDERKIYVALADIAEVGFVLAVGTLKLYRPYISCKGVGGCEVISA